MKKGQNQTISLSPQNLGPNPFRDFRVDPVNSRSRDDVASSIDQHGFWGGVCARRRPDGTYEIGAGQTRVDAARKLGLKTAEIFIGDYSDQEMILLYAKENALQRGNDGCAVAGSIISAVKYIAKDILRKNDEHKKQALIEGLHWEMIKRFLDKVKGINQLSIEEELKNLQASGDYSRTISLAIAEIRSADGEKADADTLSLVETHNQKPATYDLAGVSEHLPTASLRNAFRKIAIETAGVKEVLPVHQQAALAASLAHQAKQEKQPLTGEFVRDRITQEVLKNKQYGNKLTKEERERIEAQDKKEKLKRLQGDVVRTARQFALAFGALADFLKENKALKATLEVTNAINKTLKTIKNL